jgi:hypothetical protein
VAELPMLWDVDDDPIVRWRALAPRPASSWLLQSPDVAPFDRAKR